MILLSILLGGGAILLSRWLAPGLGNWNATLIAGAGFVVAAGLAFLVLSRTTPTRPRPESSPSDCWPPAPTPSVRKHPRPARRRLSAQPDPHQ
ncbi:MULTISPECIES: hypothetical protein [unclassified Streptomyces]|uniref:hypothetical protein n=1 Tax=unclassified Streptomyces TaxID=2593676 RepID=UPI0033F6115D